jgi:hypothetical protein
MRGETMYLDPEEQKCAWALNQPLQGALSIDDAATGLRLSAQYLKRRKAAWRRDGPTALANDNRGRTPRQALQATVHEPVVTTARGSTPG